MGMTREKAIKALNWFKEYNEEDYCGGDRILYKGDWFYKVTEEDFEAFEMAIKALEQESKSEWQKDHEILKAYSDGANEVLDKIRAEIESKRIDKYKSESEDI